MTHVMVDLETLGTRPGCKIISIGAVTFAQNTSMEFYREVLRTEQGNLHEDPDTLKWWARRPAEAKEKLFNQDDPEKQVLTLALESFSNWLRSVKEKTGPVRLWGGGADFDNAILQVAYAEVGLTPAWAFTNNRCYRTLKAMAPQEKLVRQGVHHNALDDAKSQALHAEALMVTLGLSL